MKIYVFILAFTSLYFHAIGQQQPFTAQFEDSAIAIEPGKSFTNFLSISNTGTDSLSIEKIVPFEKYPGLLLYPQGRVTIAGGESKRFPVKFLVTPELLKRTDSLLQFTISVKNAMKQETLSAYFKMLREDDRQLYVAASAPVQYVDPNLSENEISLFVENRSFHSRSIQLTYQVTPSGLKLGTAEQTIQLGPKERKSFTLKVGFAGKRSSYPDFQLVIKAVDQMSNEPVGSTSFQIVTLSSNRQLAPSYGGISDRDFVELAYGQMGGQSQMLSLRGNTGFQLGEQFSGRFNSISDVYLNENTIHIYDTWLELQKEQSILRLGTLYSDDYDYSVSGRGAKANLRPDQNRELEIMAMEKDYSIYSNRFQNRDRSKIFGAKYYTGKDAGDEMKLSYLFDHDPLLQKNSQLLHGTSLIELDRHHQLKVQTGVSLENALITGETGTGGKVGINYQSNIKRWAIQSANTLSTPYYAGTTRGSLQLNEMVNFEISPRKRAFFRYDQSQVEPKYLALSKAAPNPEDSLTLPQFHYRQQNIQAGYRSTYKNMSVTLAPQLVKQNYSEINFQDDFTSYRLQTDISTSARSSGVNLLLEWAYSKAESQAEWFSAFRTNASYRYKNLFLFAAFQVNPRDINDLRYYTEKNKGFKTYNFNASYSLTTNDHRFVANIVAGISNSELYRTANKNATGSFEYRLSDKWSATGYGSLYQYKTTGTYSSGGFNSQFRVGIKRHFGGATMPGNYRVAITLFNDKNGNGVMDADENPLESEKVQLNGQMAITDHKGRVSFQNVPKGTYELKVGQSVLSIEEDKNITVQGNKSLKIGLVKFYRVAGELSEVKQSYDSEVANVTGLVVYAKDTAGNVTSTVVDPNNHFEFFLRKGSYEIFIENTTFDFPDRSKKVLIKQSDISGLLFEFKKKNKEIKLKKF